MKANEFVKKFGWEYSKHILNEDSVILVDLNYTHLKRLIESHELVERDFGLLDIAEYQYMISASYSEAYWVRVKQAIKDVESCQ